jgi:hypothetical protein
MTPESRAMRSERWAPSTSHDEPNQSQRGADQDGPTRQLSTPCALRRGSKAELSLRLHLGTLLLHAVQEGQTLITKTLQQAPAGAWAVPKRRRYVYTQRCREQRMSTVAERSCEGGSLA